MMPAPGTTLAGGAREQEDAYRRGSVLGFTMAEVMLLLLFLLLLVLAALFLRERALSDEQAREIVTLEQQTETLQQQVSALRDVLAGLETTAPSDRFDEVFDRLVKAEEALTVADRRITGLLEERAASKAALVELQATAARLAEERDQLAAALGEATARAAAAEEKSRTAERILAELGVADPERRALGDTLAEAVAAARPELLDDPQALVAALDQTARLLADNQDLRGQIGALTRQIEGQGGGVELPSCFATADGRTEYLYDVDLRDDGRILVRSRRLPTHEAKLAALPLPPFGDAEIVTRDRFLAATRLLFEWSIDQQCRVFVRVFDATGPTQKAVYKQSLNTVEQHFYKLLAGSR